MFLALVLVPLVAFNRIGGVTATFEIIRALDPNLTSMTQGLTTIGFISLMAWGLGYAGQPHIIVRFMAIRDVKSLTAARRIGMTWMLVAIVGAVLTGFTGLAYVTQNGLSLQNPETVFIYHSCCFIR